MFYVCYLKTWVLISQFGFFQKLTKTIILESLTSQLFYSIEPRSLMMSSLLRLTFRHSSTTMCMQLTDSMSTYREYHWLYFIRPRKSSITHGCRPTNLMKIYKSNCLHSYMFYLSYALYSLILIFHQLYPAARCITKLF